MDKQDNTVAVFAAVVLVVLLLGGAGTAWAFVQARAQRAEADALRAEAEAQHARAQAQREVAEAARAAAEAGPPPGRGTAARAEPETRSELRAFLQGVLLVVDPEVAEDPSKSARELLAAAEAQLARTDLDPAVRRALARAVERARGQLRGP